MRRREQYFRDMADAAPAMVWGTDANGYCNALSRGWCDYTGQPHDEDLGVGWLDMVHPDDREEAAKIFMGALDRRETFSHDYRLRTASGDYRWAIDSGAVFREGDGIQRRTGRVVGTVKDITDRKIIEQSLQQAKQSAEVDLQIEVHLQYRLAYRDARASKQPSSE